MEIRSITDDEVPAWRASLATSFGLDPSTSNDPTGDERARVLLDRSRTFAAFDRGAIVATAAGFDFDLSLPGGSVPMSGLTMVTVRPTHRRRGILRALMQEHLAAARRRGDPLSGLWASEATIYGRFGYGVATEAESLTLTAAGARVAEGRELDEVELVDDEAVARLAPGVYDRAALQRPGMFSRTPAWWRLRRIMERPDQRAGTSPRKYAVMLRGSEPTGYVAYRQRFGMDHGVSTGTLEIDELVALDARAEATAWRYVANVDLYMKVTWWNAPVDHLAHWLFDDRRRVTRRRLETMWLRVDHVPATLTARSYAHDGTLTLGVEGEAYTLTVDGGRARCVQSDTAPEGADVRLDRATLGSIYLGAFRPSLLARAGRIAGEPAALETADRMFTSALAPWCPETF